MAKGSPSRAALGGGGECLSDGFPSWEEPPPAGGTGPAWTFDFVVRIMSRPLGDSRVQEERPQAGAPSLSHLHCGVTYDKGCGGAGGVPGE